MSNEKVRPSTNAIRNVNDIVKLLEWEDQQIALAGGYVDLFPDVDISSVDDFVEVIQETLNKYIDREHAFDIIEELNRFISNWDNFKQDFKVRHGAKSADYEEIRRIGSYINSSPPIANLWELQKADKEMFKKFVSIVSQNSQTLIPSPTVARMAILHLHIWHYTEKMSQATDGCDDYICMHIMDGYKAGAALNELELAAGLLDETTLKKLHRIGAKANKKKRDDKKYKDICDDAKSAWNLGCELLHTQMLNLFLLYGKIGSDDKTCVNNKLKKIAPSNRLYGSGVKKIIDSCPCNNQHQCPLIKKINPKKAYDLPVSNKDLK